MHLVDVDRPHSAALGAQAAPYFLNLLVQDVAGNIAGGAKNGGVLQTFAIAKALIARFDATHNNC
jgi:hypothetical protein